MKNDRIQRFTLTEVLFHWLNAVVYLLLIVTGATMLAEHFFEVQWAGRPTFSVVHRVAGVSLVLILTQTFVLSLFAGRFRQLWLSLRQCLSWGRPDILWMLKVPLNMFSRRIGLPPVGRFNPGQKLHILTVFMLLCGLCVSGLAIILIPGALAPWIIHLTCFVPAVFFVCLHLFFSLINPTTRKALPGIFTGFVSRDYAREHHALLLGETDEAVHKSYVSWPAASLYLLAIGVMLTVIIWLYGFNRFAGNISSVIAHRGANLIMPGELSASHTAELRAGRCAACHEKFRSVTSNACLRCHERISRVMADGIGYHGKLTGKCRSCHSEHLGGGGDIRRFDAAAFNHDLATFALAGKHRELSCDKCHLQEGAGGVYLRTKYIGLEYEDCSDCHENPHGEARAANCVKCHTLRSWKEPYLLFVHDRDSEFRLEGKHSDTPCQECHMSEHDSVENAEFILYGIGATCSGCHHDPHGGQFTKGCEACHSAQGWKGKWLWDAHGSSSAHPLRGKHATVDCLKCHTPSEQGAVLAEARFVGLPEDCASCHEDPHNGQMRSSCDTCHTEQGWAGRSLLFAHDRHSEFKMDKIHYDLSCTLCHGADDVPLYRPLPTTCELCHVDIVRQQFAVGYPAVEEADPHAGRVSCVECHPPELKHQTPAGYADACLSCHNRRYEGLFYDWMKSLKRRESRSRDILERMREQDSDKADALEQRIDRTKSIGLHNLELALRLWGEIEN